MRWAAGLDPAGFGAQWRRSDRRRRRRQSIYAFRSVAVRNIPDFPDWAWLEVKRAFGGGAAPISSNDPIDRAIRLHNQRDV
jgi:hypothetical protein